MTILSTIKGWFTKSEKPKYLTDEEVLAKYGKEPEHEINSVKYSVRERTTNELDKPYVYYWRVFQYRSGTHEMKVSQKPEGQSGYYGGFDYRWVTVPVCEWFEVQSGNTNSLEDATKKVEAWVDIYRKPPYRYDSPVLNPAPIIEEHPGTVSPVPVPQELKWVAGPTSREYLLKDDEIEVVETFDPGYPLPEIGLNPKEDQ